METLYRDLAEDIKTIEQYNQSMDSASWGYEEGILLTGNQAKAILEHTAQLKADKAELLEAIISCHDYFKGQQTLQFGEFANYLESLIQKT